MLQGKFQAYLGYRVRPCLEKNQTKPMKGLALDGLGELYKCVGKVQQVITGLVTSAYNPSTWEAKASGSWV